MAGGQEIFDEDAVETAAEFFKRRAGNATSAGLLAYLENAPDVDEAEDSGETR